MVRLPVWGRRLELYFYEGGLRAVFWAALCLLVGLSRALTLYGDMTVDYLSTLKACCCCCLRPPPARLYLTCGLRKGLWFSFKLFAVYKLSEERTAVWSNVSGDWKNLPAAWGRGDTTGDSRVIEGSLNEGSLRVNLCREVFWSELMIIGFFKFVASVWHF